MFRVVDQEPEKIDSRRIQKTQICRMPIAGLVCGLLPIFGCNQFWLHGKEVLYYCDEWVQKGFEFYWAMQLNSGSGQFVFRIYRVL